MNAITLYNSLSKIGEEREYRIQAEMVYMDSVTVADLETMKAILKKLTEQGLIEWITWFEPHTLDWVIKIKRIK